LIQKARTACLLAGYVLDLIGHKKISLEPHPKKKDKVLVVPQDSFPVGNYLDLLFDKIKDNKKPKTLRKLIFKEHMTSIYLEAVLDHLVNKAILRRDVSKKLYRSTIQLL